MLKKNDSVLIFGDNELAISIALCLLLAKQAVAIYTLNPVNTLNTVKNYLSDGFDLTQLKLIDHLVDDQYPLAIVITPENITLKRAAIKLIENNLSAAALLAINTESILLDDIQQGAQHPERIIGTNWVQPVHTTYFMEIVCNQLNTPVYVRSFYAHAKLYWNKDPYILQAGYGIRARLMCALMREAFYLVENGYVTVEDIDRACRNDAGYYLPFSGNFRYMDLMGTYIYGLVMKDINPDLSTNQHIPTFFNDLIDNNHLGMQTGKGFYDYPNGTALEWKILSEKFSHQIQFIIGQYPFNYLKEDLAPTQEIIV